LGRLGQRVDLSFFQNKRALPLWQGFFVGKNVGQLHIRRRNRDFWQPGLIIPSRCRIFTAFSKIFQ
jgi:hypothetical protein